MKAAEDFDNQLNAGGRSAQLVKAVDSRLRKQTQELHVRCTKVRVSLFMRHYVGYLRWRLTRLNTSLN